MVSFACPTPAQPVPLLYQTEPPPAVLSSTLLFPQMNPASTSVAQPQPPSVVQSSPPLPPQVDPEGLVSRTSAHKDVAAWLAASARRNVEDYQSRAPPPLRSPRPRARPRRANRNSGGAECVATGRSGTERTAVPTRDAQVVDDTQDVTAWLAASVDPEGLVSRTSAHKDVAAWLAASARRNVPHIPSTLNTPPALLPAPPGAMAATPSSWTAPLTALATPAPPPCSAPRPSASSRARFSQTTLSRRCSTCPQMSTPATQQSPSWRASCAPWQSQPATTRTASGCTSTRLPCWSHELQSTVSAGTERPIASPAPHPRCSSLPCCTHMTGFFLRANQTQL